jgi:hypothetical protein
MVEQGIPQVNFTESEETRKKLSFNPLKAAVIGTVAAALVTEPAAISQDSDAESLANTHYQMANNLGHISLVHSAEDPTKPIVASSKPQKTSHLTKVIPTPLPPILKRIGGCESSTGPNSKINYTAQNDHTTASGGFQFLDTTWDNFRGYRKAKYAPPRIQNWRAKIELKKNGTSPWVSSEHCWG